MMVELTQEQYDILDHIANSGQSGARVLYYEKLAEFGVAYGYLAQGVVLEDQISGRVANAYFMAVADREGVSVSSLQWSAIGDGLMQADLAARLAAGDVDSNGNAIYPDLGYEDIRDYHQDVFSDLGGTVAPGEGVSIEAWTAYAPVETGGLLVWDQLLSEASFWRNSFGAITLAGMWAYSKYEDDALADEWADIIWRPSFQSLLSSGSPVQYENQLENSLLMLGTHTAEQMAVDASVSDETQVLLMGLGGADTISVEASGNYFDGGAGDDLFLIHDMYGDQVHGGTGTDTADLSSQSEAVQFGLSADYVSAGLGDLYSVERIIATDHDDSFHFHDPVNAMFVESIEGGVGTDTIFLPDGIENLQIDLAQERIVGLQDITVSGIEDVYGGDASEIILGSAVANRLSGNSGDDEIEGREGNDTLSGGVGNDSLFGGAGNDTVWGGGGHDSLNGGGGWDYLAAGAGNDSMLGGAGLDTLYGGDGTDTLRGGGNNDLIFGDADNDWLFGNAGNDNLLGGAGDDWLDGGDGEDYLHGGPGADIFVFGLGEDTFADFVVGVDSISGDGGPYEYEAIQGTPTSPGVRITAGGYSAVLPLVTLEQAQTYDLWA